MWAPFAVCEWPQAIRAGTQSDNKISNAAQAVDAGDGQGTIADREADALGRAQSHIAAGEDARQARLQRARLTVGQGPFAGGFGVGAGEEIALAVAGDLIGQPVGERL